MNNAAGNPSRYLIFHAGGRMAIAIGRVAEVLPFVELTAPPAAGSAIAGTVNFSGSAVTVLKTATLLGLDEPAPTIHAHLIRLRGVDPPLALLSERSTEILDAADVTVAPASGSATFNGCIGAEIVSADRSVAYLLDIDRLLTEEERLRLADFGRRAQERLDALEATA